MTFASAVLEAIDALLALAYIGLQIYYGVCYHIQVFKFVANILVLLLVYIAITWLQHYPEKLNHIAAELCVGNIRKYSLRLLTFVKLVFTAGLLVPCVCDVADISKRASMIHLEAPRRIDFTSARCPSSSPMAPRIIDFPAPVSPVITEKPVSKLISSFSINA